LVFWIFRDEKPVPHVCETRKVSNSSPHLRSHNPVPSSRMIGKAAILLLAALLSVVSANESLRGSTNSGVEELLNQILAKLETQDKTIETLNLRVTELETQMVEDRGSYMSRRLNETDYDDDDCLPKYNSTLGYCVFDMPLKISEDTVFDGEVSFESETFFFDDVAIFDDLRIGNDNNDATLTVGGAARFESFTYFEEDVSDVRMMILVALMHVFFLCLF
jgi:hypothetical protein